MPAAAGSTFTLECSGNTGLPFFIGGVGNARWVGTPLAPVLERAGIQDPDAEVVFFGADSGPVTIKDNSGVVRGPDAPRRLTITEQFARSMTVDEAMDRDNLLCWEMNGVPLPREHGFPLRLIAPGWYGVANVKWLTRIEVMDQRWAGRFMARDYVTIREPHPTARPSGRSTPSSTTGSSPRRRRSPAAAAATPSWAPRGAHRSPRSRSRSTAGPGAPPSSRAAGAGATAMGSPGGSGPSTGAGPPPAITRIRSRAYDVEGNLQPPPDDPYLASKVTYWESNGQITRRVRIPVP